MIYESPLDRAAQDALQAHLEALGFEVRQSSTKAHWDMALRRSGKPWGLVEFKSRTTAYPTLYVDQRKIQALIRMATQWRVRPLLIVRWEGIPGYWWWYCDDSVPTRAFTRKKERGIVGETRDKPDRVCVIPRKKFRKVC